MSAVVSQSELPLVKQPEMRLIGVDKIAIYPDLLSVINLCVQEGIETDPVSGNPRKLHDSKISDGLSLDKGHWSRIKDGQAHLAANLFNPLMVKCRNYAPLEWLAFSNGFDLVKRKSRLETELEDANRRADEAERKNAYLLEIINGSRT